MIAVRRSAWEKYIFQQPRLRGQVEKLSGTTKKRILDALALAT
jgi:hypothetical protein